MVAMARSLCRQWAISCVIRTVQLSIGTAAPDCPLTGRAEHFVSGWAAHFQSAAELLAFLSDVLRPSLPPSQGAATQGNRIRQIL